MENHHGETMGGFYINNHHCWNLKVLIIELGKKHCFNGGGFAQGYCWWFRNPAITTWYGKCPIFHRVLHVSTAAGIRNSGINSIKPLLVNTQSRATSPFFGSDQIRHVRSMRYRRNSERLQKENESNSIYKKTPNLRLVFYGIVNVRNKFTKHQLVGKILPWWPWKLVGPLGFNCLSFRGDRQLQSQGRRQWGRSRRCFERQYLKTKVLKSNIYIIYIYIC